MGVSFVEGDRRKEKTRKENLAEEGEGKGKEEEGNIFGSSMFKKKKKTYVSAGPKATQSLIPVVLRNNRDQMYQQWQGRMWPL